MKPSSRLKSALLAAVLSGVASISLLAQDATPAPSASPGPRPSFDRGHPPHHPPSPLMEALDTNHDGILSADEIANASASLKKLDKNGDGQLTEDELRPPPPPGGPNGGPPPHGHRGPGDSSAITPDQQAPDKDARPQPSGPKQGPAVAEASPEQVPVGARAQRQPPRLSVDPVVARLEQAAPKAD